MKTSDEIKRSLDAHCCPFSCGECEYEKIIFCRDHLMKDVQVLIQQLEARVPKWISVEERLPEVGTMVLVHDGSRAYVVEYTPNGLFEDDYGYCHYIDDYTHWMPLPEPPKEVAE